MPSRVDPRSARRVRALLGKVEPEARQEVAAAIRDGANRMLGSMQADVPRGDTGDLAAGLEARISRNGLRARVGIIGKRKQRELFYARFQEFGTAHHAAQPFRRPALDEQGPIVIRNVERGVDQALIRLSRGRR